MDRKKTMGNQIVNTIPLAEFTLCAFLSYKCSPNFQRSPLQFSKVLPAIFQPVSQDSLSRMTKFVAYTFLVMVGAVIIELASADLKEITCKGQTFQINEEQQMSMKECLTKMGLSSVKDLTANNAGCFARCSMMQKGLIDDAGKPHKEKIMNLMDEHIPDSIKGDWIPAIEKCLDSEGSKVDMKDEKTCTSFLPLTLCVHQSFLTICKS